MKIYKIEVHVKDANEATRLRAIVNFEIVTRKIEAGPVSLIEIESEDGNVNPE